MSTFLQTSYRNTLFDIKRVIFLHHNNCGASHVTKDQVKADLNGKRPDFETAPGGGGGGGGGAQWTDLEARLPMVEDNSHRSLKEDLAKIRNCAFLAMELVNNAVGLYLDVNSGLVTRVEPDPVYD